jgi:hypothetical protein
MGTTLAYLGAAVVALWGLAHAIPTTWVVRWTVRDFGDISTDNRRVITQEWVAEALTMWFVAGVVVVVTAAGRSNLPVVHWVYRVAAVMLLAVALLTALTGARTRVIWFKICPFLLAGTAALLLAASIV